MLLSQLMDTEDLDRAIADGFVSARPHQELPLTILNYTPQCQYAQEWTDVTMQCRGLIIDSLGNVVARPFAKFMNYGTAVVPRDAINKRPFVTEKMDGSLGIIYWNGMEWAVATRGSFHSEQAEHATARLKHYIDVEDTQALPYHLTHLVEIIYPTNRIVVDYGKMDELVLIAVIDKDTGADVLDWSTWPGEKTVIHEDVRDVQAAYMTATSNYFNKDEGLVCCWPRLHAPSFRLKVKNNEYLRLHKILTGISTKTIFEIMSTNGDMNALLEDAPDEFHEWIRTVIAELSDGFRAIEGSAQDEFLLHDGRVHTRKDFAAAVQHSLYRDILFKMYDGKEYDSLIWRRMKPEFRLFREDIDGG